MPGVNRTPADTKSRREFVVNSTCLARLFVQLILREHTAALDPKAAQRVIEFTEKLVRENHLTTIMVTHNMQQAIRYGNRMIMLHEGKVKFDIQGKEKKALTVEEVVKRFGADLKDEALLCA